MSSKLMHAAVESLEDDAALPSQEIPFEQGDAVFAEADQLDIAAEALTNRLLSLESIVETIQNVPVGEVTPALAAVVQASILLPDEPAIATEANDDDITDVEAKSSRWDNLKGKAATAAKTVAAAVKAVINAIIEFMQNVFDWIMSSERVVAKRLQDQKAKLSSAPASVDIAYNRHLAPLTISADFSARSATAALSRYAEVMASAAYVVQDIFVYANFLTPDKVSYNPGKLNDLQKTFKERTSGALSFEEDAAKMATRGAFGLSDSTATVYDGVGGVKVDVSVTSRGLIVSTVAVDSEGATSEATFTKNEMVKINGDAIKLLHGVKACGGEIKKVQSSMRKLMTLWSMSDGKITLRGVSKNPPQIFMELRTYLNYASKCGVARALKASHAAAVLGSKFVGGAAVNNAEDDTTSSGEIEHKRLAYNG